MSNNLRQEVLHLCRLYNIKPDKSKGQNFLVDESVYDKIIETADLKKTDTVIEVGPGLGVLTMKIARRVKRVLAVELDPRLSEILNLIIKSHNIANVKIFNRDILQARGQGFSQLGDYKIVSNLPYNISSVFLRKILSLENKPQSLVLLLQKELVERIVASPPQMSLLSASVQFYASAQFIFTVDKSSFYPQPKVDSAVIKIIPDKKYLSNYKEEKKFFSLLRSSFSSKRKMLKNNLASSLKISSGSLINILQELSLSPEIRAEQLSVSDWLRFYDELLKNNLLF